MFRDMLGGHRISDAIVVLLLLILSSCSENPVAPPDNPAESFTELQVTITSPMSVQLNWGKLDPREEWYLIERREGETGPYREAGTTTDTIWAESWLLATKSYSYRVHAYIDEERIRTTRTVHLPNLNFPPPVLQGFIRSQSSILLEWRDTYESETGFLLYANSALVAQFGPGDSTYTHEGLLLGTTYEYWLVAVADGYVSAESNALKIHFDLSEPEAPSLEYRSEKEFLLSWSYEGPPDADGFRIVRRKEGEEEFLPLGTVGPDTLSFLVSDPDTSQVDTYAVESLGGSGYFKRSPLRHVGYGSYELSNELVGYGTPAAFDASRTKLATVTGGDVIAVFDVNGWRKEWSVLSGTILSLSFDVPRNNLLSWHTRGICVFNAENGSRRVCNYYTVSRVLLDPLGELFVEVLGSSTRVLSGRATDSGSQIWYLDLGDTITAIEWSSDGQAIVVGTQSGKLVALDREGNIVWAQQLPSTIGALASAPDGSAIAAAHSGIVTVYEALTGDARWTHDLKFGATLLVYSPSGETLVASGGSYGGAIGLHGLTGQVLWSLKSRLRRAAFSSDEKRIASGATVLYPKMGLVQWSTDFPAEWGQFLNEDRVLILTGSGTTRIYRHVPAWRIYEPL